MIHKQPVINMYRYSRRVHAYILVFHSPPLEQHHALDDDDRGHENRENKEHSPPEQTRDVGSAHLFMTNTSYVPACT